MPYPGLLHPEPLPLWQATADPYHHRRNSNIQMQDWFSLYGVLWCAQSFVWAIRVSLPGMGFDFKLNFTTSTIFLGLLLCPWTWGISSVSLQHHTATSPVLTNWCEVASAYYCFPKPCYSTDKTREPWLRSWGSRKVLPKLQTPKTYCSYPETYQKNGHFAYNPSPKSEYYLQMS